MKYEFKNMTIELFEQLIQLCDELNIDYDYDENNFDFVIEYCEYDDFELIREFLKSNNIEYKIER